MITLISPDDFLKEVKQWVVGNQFLYKIRSMKKEGIVFLRFAIPRTVEVIETQFLVSDWDSFDFMNYADKIVPAIWKNENRVVNLLEEINAKLASNNRVESLQHNELVTE